MIRELKDGRTYSSTMLVLAVLACVFGIAFVFIGELLLPFASAFLALLFVLEKPNARYLSYICSIIPVAAAFIAKGIFGLISLQLVFVAVIIALTYRFNASKAECAAYLTVTVSLFAVLSLYFGGAKATGSFDAKIILDYYSDVFTALKLQLLDVMNQYAVSRGEANAPVFTVTDATELAAQLKPQLVSLIAIFAFILSGITLKIFTFGMFKVSKRGILKRFAHFLPRNLVSYVYVAVAILSLFSGTGSIFDSVILNFANILAVVFAYIGFQYLTTVASAAGRRRLAITLCIISLFIVPAVSFRLLSFLGVWASVGINNAMNGNLPPSFDR